MINSAPGSPSTNGKVQKSNHLLKALMKHIGIYAALSIHNYCHTVLHHRSSRSKNQPMILESDKGFDMQKFLNDKHAWMLKYKSVHDERAYNTHPEVKVHDEIYFQSYQNPHKYIGPCKTLNNGSNNVEIESKSGRALVVSRRLIKIKRNIAQHDGRRDIRARTLLNAPFTVRRNKANSTALVSLFIQLCQYISFGLAAVPSSTAHDVSRASLLDVMSSPRGDLIR
jgi:hypothetical protein